MTKLKYFIVILPLVLITTSINGQYIEIIPYRGDSINVYPTDSISMVDVKLIPSLPDGKYYGFFKGDTAFLRIVIEYINQKVEGNVVEYYYANRDTTEITGYHKGVKHGYWAVYEHEDGQSLILHEGVYEKGKKIGLQYSYYGDIDERKVYNKEFYEDGKEIYNIWHGLDSTYFVNDTGYVYTFDGKRNLVGTGKSYKRSKFGYWKRYFSIPDIWTMGEYELWNWHDGFPQSRKTGLWEDFYSNGQLSRRYIYDHGIRVGGIATVIEQYDIEGNLLDSMSYVDGVGIYKEFYSLGKIKREEFYSSPNNLVYEKVYTESEGLSVLIEYPTDSIKVRTCYYPNGQIESVEHYKAFMWWNFGSKDDYHKDYEKFGIQEYYNKDGILIKKENITERIIEE